MVRQTRTQWRSNSVMFKGAGPFAFLPEDSGPAIPLPKVMIAAGYGFAATSRVELEAGSVHSSIDGG